MVTKRKLHAVKRHQTQNAYSFMHHMFLRQEIKLQKLKFAENMAYNKKSLQKMNPIKYTN